MAAFFTAAFFAGAFLAAFFLLPKVYLSWLIWGCSCGPQLFSLQPSCRRALQYCSFSRQTSLRPFWPELFSLQLSSLQPFWPELFSLQLSSLPPSLPGPSWLRLSSLAGFFAAGFFAALAGAGADSGSATKITSTTPASITPGTMMRSSSSLRVRSPVRGCLRTGCCHRRSHC